MTDDLSKISGIGPATVEKLKSRGITAFAQIAELTDDQVLQLNDELDLRDGIINGDWRSQAKVLAGGLSDPLPESTGSGPGETSSVTQTVPVRINRDFWDTEGVRQRKGSVIEVSIEEAFAGLESGALSRVK